jgi:hypothetical protein
MFGEYIFAQSILGASGVVKEWKEMCEKVTAWTVVDKNSSTAQNSNVQTSVWSEISKSVIRTNKCSN